MERSKLPSFNRIKNARPIFSNFSEPVYVTVNLALVCLFFCYFFVVLNYSASFEFLSTLI